MVSDHRGSCRQFFQSWTWSEDDGPWRTSYKVLGRCHVAPTHKLCCTRPNQRAHPREINVSYAERIMEAAK
jgi:hypothetical protein